MSKKYRHARILKNLVKERMATFSYYDYCCFDKNSFVDYDDRQIGRHTFEILYDVEHHKFILEETYQGYANDGGLCHDSAKYEIFKSKTAKKVAKFLNISTKEVYLWAKPIYFVRNSLFDIEDNHRMKLFYENL